MGARENADPAATPLWLRWGPWLFLIAPLVALLAAVWGEDRAGWRQLRAGETTRLMLAESLLEDGDLRFERLDFDRHLVTRYGLPRDLALVSGNGGRTLTYDAPLLTSLVMVGGLALFGDWGFHAAGAFLLAAALLFAAWRLSPRLGPWAPCWLAVLAFGGLPFVYVFHGSGDLTLFAAVLAAAAVARGGPARAAAAADPRRRRPSALPPPWLAAGLLLSVAVFSRWQHVLLLLPFALAAGEEARQRAAPRLALGFGVLVGVVAQSLAQWLAGGGLGLFDSVGFLFTPETGYPTIDFPTENWSYTVGQLAGLHFTGAARLSWGLEPRLVAWNALYLAIGQSIGILVYGGLPALFLLLAGGGRRRALVGWFIGAGAGLLLLLVLSPFDLFGGAEGATGVRFLLPWLAASAVAWERPRRRLLGFAEPAAACGAAALLLLASAPFMINLWLKPSAPPSTETEEGQKPAHVAPAARALLPAELSQQQLPGGPYLDHRGLRVRLADADVREPRLDVFALSGADWATLWVASPEPLAAVVLAFGEEAPSTLEVPGGAEPGLVLRPDGGIDFRLEPSARRHGMWWSPEAQWLYPVTFRLPTAGEGELEFYVAGEIAAAAEGAAGQR
ncbi:MAG: hypothetical protein AAF725_04790 [Acidobacteriota bacterium]